MNLHKKIFAITSVFFIALLLTAPLQAIYADDTSSTDASSTPTDTTTATSTDPVIPTVDTSTTTPDDSNSTPDTASTTPDEATSTASSTAVVIPDPVTINLEIDTASSTLFNGPLTVSACPVEVGTTTETVNGFCA